MNKQVKLNETIEDTKRMIIASLRRKTRYKENDSRLFEEESYSNERFQFSSQNPEQFVVSPPGLFVAACDSG